MKEARKEPFVYERTNHGKSLMGNQHFHHEMFEVYFLEEGNCHYFIDDKAYDVIPGDVVLVPEGVIHKTMYDNAGHSRRLLYLSPSYIPTSVLMQLSSLLYVYRNPALTERIRGVFDAIEEEYLSPNRFSEDALRHYAGILFCLLARNAAPSMLPAAENAYTTQTIAYIKGNYREEIRLSDLARRCSISPEHLSRLFKRETGFGISEYLTMIRLQQACRLLREAPHLQVAKIADLCGYNDSNYFSEQFKRAYGTSPLHFRKHGFPPA